LENPPHPVVSKPAARVKARAAIVARCRTTNTVLYNFTNHNDNARSAAGYWLIRVMVWLVLAGATPRGSHRREAEGLLVFAGGLNSSQAARIIEFAQRQRLPAMYALREHVDAGGLMAYGPNYLALHRRAAYYVDRILKGTKPADLPVEQPMTFDFVVNLKTAQALGLTFPNEILLQVTEAIQ
jgi:ABC-type uncharacterized transport system substrate-binding protein